MLECEVVGEYVGCYEVGYVYWVFCGVEWRCVGEFEFGEVFDVYFGVDCCCDYVDLFVDVFVVGCLGAEYLVVWGEDEFEV